MKKLKFPILILAFICLLVFITTRKKPNETPKKDSWEKVDVNINQKQLEKLNFNKPMFIDEIIDSNFYIYPSIPTDNEYTFNKIMKFNEEKTVLDVDIDEIKDLATPLEFKGYEQNLNTYNKLNLKESVLLNANTKLYLINKKDFSYKAIKDFKASKDYNRRFKFLYLDKDNLYYIFNNKDENGNFDSLGVTEDKSPKILYKENINTKEIEEINLEKLNLIHFNDFIHSEYVGIDNYLLNVVDDSIYRYNILDGKNEKIMTKTNYYFDPLQAIVTDEYYIEHSIFGNYGVGIFDRNSGELLNVITDSDRYGSIHNMKLYGHFLLLEPSFNTNAKMNSFKIVDLKNKKTYYYKIKDSIKPLLNNLDFDYKVLGLDKGYAYIQTVSKDKSNKINYNLFKLKIDLINK